MMKKSRGAIKNYQIFLIFFLAPFSSALTASPIDDLKAADSLFQAKKYTESFELYDQLFNSQNLSSPSMLLKMAFIKEGLGDYSNALYFLNTYFNITLDRKALDKIDELVKANELKGYGIKGQVYTSELIYKYYRFVLVAILTMLFTGMLFSAKIASKGKTIVPLITIMIMLIPFIVAINYEFKSASAIIMKDTTYLMDGPSGSANVIETLSKGHKLTVQKSEGVWSRVKWDNQTYYVRTSKLKELI